MAWSKPHRQQDACCLETGSRPTPAEQGTQLPFFRGRGPLRKERAQTCKHIGQARPWPLLSCLTYTMASTRVSGSRGREPTRQLPLHFLSPAHLPLHITIFSSTGRRNHPRNATPRCSLVDQVSTSLGCTPLDGLDGCRREQAWAAEIRVPYSGDVSSWSGPVMGVLPRLLFR